MKIVLLIYLLVGVFFSPIGYFIHTTAGKAGVNIYLDKAHHLEKAFIATDEQLYVCVTGVYEQEETEYWIYLPVVTLANAPESIDGVDGFKGYWKDSFQQIWHIPRGNIIVRNCTSDPAETKRTIPIRTLKGSLSHSYKTESILMKDFGESDYDELAYQIAVTDGTGNPIEAIDLAYGSKLLRFEGKNAITFATNSYRKRGSRGWYVVLPFACLLDIVSWPIQLFMWIRYGESH